MEDGRNCPQSDMHAYMSERKQVRNKYQNVTSHALPYAGLALPQRNGLRCVLALSRGIVVPNDLHCFIPPFFFFGLFWDIDNYYYNVLPLFVYEIHPIHPSNQHQLSPFHPLIW